MPEKPWDGITERRKDKLSVEDELLVLLGKIAGKQKEPRWFGFSVVELVRVGVVIVCFAITFAQMKVSIDNLTKSNVYLLTFAQNSDNYNSSVTGVQFRQGQPLYPVPR